MTPNSTPLPARPPDGFAPRIDVGVVVADLAVARQFYESVLGFEVEGEARTSILEPGSMLFLRHGSSLVKLLAFDQPSAPQERNPIGAGVGISYITVLVPAVAPIERIVQTPGIEIKQPLTELANGAHIAMVRDPDGNIIELVAEP